MQHRQPRHWHGLAAHDRPTAGDNSGPTWTQALLPGSEAIDATLATEPCMNEEITPLTTDQRGAARIVGARCDVGAYEFGAHVDPIFKNGLDYGSTE